MIISHVYILSEVLELFADVDADVGIRRLELGVVGEREGEYAGNRHVVNGPAEAELI